jgi:hypothetical protein
MHFPYDRFAPCVQCTIWRSLRRLKMLPNKPLARLAPVQAPSRRRPPRNRDRRPAPHGLELVLPRLPLRRRQDEVERVEPVGRLMLDDGIDEAAFVGHPPRAAMRRKCANPRSPAASQAEPGSSAVRVGLEPRRSALNAASRRAGSAIAKACVAIIKLIVSSSDCAFPIPFSSCWLRPYCKNLGLLF